jgi:hypothetical protein
LAITNGYCSLAELKAAARVSDSIDDSLMEIAIEAASREIDGHCNRVFYSTTGTRVYNPVDTFVTNTDDIISVTTLKTSSNAEVYDQTWQTTDFQLEPLNGVSGGLVQPYTRIRAVGDYLFPIWSVGSTYNNFAPVQVVGVFGWSAVPTAVKQACILLAMRQWKRYDSPLGVAGFSDIAAIRVGRTDPDVEALLQPFKKAIAS